MNTIPSRLDQITDRLQGLSAIALLLSDSSCPDSLQPIFRLLQKDLMDMAGEIGRIADEIERDG